jgi:hypothetical protein
MPATQSRRNEALPQRITQAQVDEEKRKLRERMEEEMRQAEKRLFGGGGVAFGDHGSDLPLPRRTIAPPVLEPPSAQTLPTRIKVQEPPPEAIELPTYKPSRSVESNVVALPTRNMALPEARTGVTMAPLAPPDLPTRQMPTRVFVGERTAGMTTLEIREAELRQLETAGVDSKVRVTPEGVEVSPPQKMSRKRGSFEGAILGLASGGLAGAAVGAVTGAVAPGRMARRGRQEEIARASRRVDEGMDREARAAQIESARSLADQRRNQPAEDAAKAADAARKERIARLMTNIGRSGYNPDDPSDAGSQLLKREAELLGVADQIPAYKKGDRVPPRITIDGITFERQDNGDWRPAKGLPTRQMIDVPGYGKMTPAQARIADATEQNRQEQRSRNERLDTRHVTERREDIDLRETDRTRDRQAKAAAIVADIEEANANAGKYQALADRTPEGAKDLLGNALKPFYADEAELEKKKAVGLARALTEAYGDLYEAGAGQQGWAYVKPKNLSTKQGGKIQPGEDPDVRAYANQFFRGDYQKALDAIARQKKK